MREKPGRIKFYALKVLMDIPLENREAVDRILLAINDQQVFKNNGETLNNIANWQNGKIRGLSPKAMIAMLEMLKDPERWTLAFVVKKLLDNDDNQAFDEIREAIASGDDRYRYISIQSFITASALVKLYKHKTNEYCNIPDEVVWDDLK